MKNLTYAEYHRLMGEWLATGRINGTPARQVAHEWLATAKCVTVRVYWHNGQSAEFAVPRTAQEGAEWPTTKTS